MLQSGYSATRPIVRPAADEMPEGVTAEGVSAEEYNVHGEDNSADAEAPGMDVGGRMVEV